MLSAVCVQAADTENPMRRVFMNQIKSVFMETHLNVLAKKQHFMLLIHLTQSVVQLTSEIIEL